LAAIKFAYLVDLNGHDFTYVFGSKVHQNTKSS
jgi:hypothetical protein